MQAQLADAAAAHRAHIAEMPSRQPVDPLGDRQPRNPILQALMPPSEPLGLAYFEHVGLYPMEYRWSITRSSSGLSLRSTAKHGRIQKYFLPCTRERRKRGIVGFAL